MLGQSLDHQFESYQIKFLKTTRKRIKKKIAQLNTEQWTNQNFDCNELIDAKNQLASINRVILQKDI